MKHLQKLGQHVQEPVVRAPAAGEGRKIRADEERLSLGGEPDGKRPSAAAAQMMSGLHVHRVHVGALFPIHFDGDVIRVEEGGDALVFERFLFHDVTPVARRVADGEKHRPIEPPRFAERFIAPGKPVDRIVCVLQQIRARLECQTIRVKRLAVVRHVASAGRNWLASQRGRNAGCDGRRMALASGQSGHGLTMTAVSGARNRSLRKS